MRKINIGCGAYKRNDCINIDRNAKLHPDMVRDVTRGLPFDDNSVEAVYAFHFLEHLTNEDMLFVLEECYRVLIDRGRLHIQVPVGFTGALDHKLVFREDSFSTLTKGQETKDYYQTEMQFECLAQQTFEDRPISLDIILAAIKS